MTPLTSWLQTVRKAPAVPPGIDLGNGRRLGAEDVLEGHYRRLAARRRPRTRNVAVQVGDNLIAAITVLAPDLAPLTELAEEVAEALPPVQPAPQFREHLHLALERTHRQHAAQRALGTRVQPRPARVTSNPRLTLVLAALVVLAFLGWQWLGRRSPATGAA